MAEDASRLAQMESNLAKNLQAAHLSAGAPLSNEEIAAIVRQVVMSLSGDISASDLKFYAELEDLANYIRHAKEEIAAIKPKDISTDHIPRATDELDAVVGATEEATNKIMDVCDEISTIAGVVGEENGEKLINCTTKIFEACNFQDITGQRITKVVQTLKHIDTKVEALLQALGDEIHCGTQSGSSHGGMTTTPRNTTPAATTADPDKQLLNGPQLPSAAIDQATIDKMLSGE